MATEQQINWGGIIKGVAIVSAVAIGCVAVGLVGATAMGAVAGGHGAAAVIIHGITHVAMLTWHLLGQALVTIGQFIVGLSNHLGLTTALQGAGFTAAAPAATVVTAKTAAGLALGGAAAVALAPAAIKATTAMTANMTVPVHVPDPTVAATPAAVVDPSPAVVDPGSHTVAVSKASAAADFAHNGFTGGEAQHADLSFKAGQHAATHGDDSRHHQNWASRVGHTRPAPEVQPRDASFTKQAVIDADKAAAAGQEPVVA